jgi:hypothetical protein
MVAYTGPMKRPFVAMPGMVDAMASTDIEYGARVALREACSSAPFPVTSRAYAKDSAMNR